MLPNQNAAKSKCLQIKMWPNQNVSKSKCCQIEMSPNQNVANKNVSKSECRQMKMSPNENVAKSKCSQILSFYLSMFKPKSIFCSRLRIIPWKGWNDDDDDRRISIQISFGCFVPISALSQHPRWEGEKKCTNASIWQLNLGFEIFERVSNNDSKITLKHF